MSYALVEDVAASWESYERIGIQLEHARPDGLILHAAGRTDEGVRIIEVWVSEDARRRYVQGVDRCSDALFSGAPRHVRELEPSHLVLGSTSPSINEGGSRCAN